MRAQQTMTRTLSEESLPLLFVRLRHELLERLCLHPLCLILANLARHRAILTLGRESSERKKETKETRETERRRRSEKRERRVEEARRGARPLSAPEKTAFRPHNFWRDGLR